MTNGEAREILGRFHTDCICRHEESVIIEAVDAAVERERKRWRLTILRANRLAETVVEKGMALMDLARSVR